MTSSGQAKSQSKLTEQEKIYAEAVLGSCVGNDIEAVRVAGFTCDTLEELIDKANELKRNPDILEYLADAMTRRSLVPTKEDCTKLSWNWARSPMDVPQSKVSCLRMVCDLCGYFPEKGKEANPVEARNRAAELFAQNMGLRAVVQKKIKEFYEPKSIE